MKYFIATFGCQANEADSERIAARLEKMGHKKTSDKKKAGLIVINACSVRQSAIDRVHGKIRNFAKFKNQNSKIKIILAGCVLEKDKKKFGEKVDEIWHPDEYFDLKPAYSGKSAAHVPIMSGCNNFCTYCAVPYTRGRERSRPAKDIIKEVKNLVKKRYKEIWLLGQNVNSYCSGKINFPKLLLHLNTIVDKCSAKCYIRFTSPHPKDFSDELIKTIAECDKVTKYINLPVQSGDNEILKRMNRNYTREKYIKLVNKIRKAVPDIKMSTDVIVGFPGETRKQFQNTVDLFERIGFDKAYVSRFSPRPGTAAFNFKDNISPKEKKRRWKILDKIANAKKKIIVVLGPTASSKSDLAVDIAQKFSGEIISADSRQVYKGMDIGTGKITPDTKNFSNFSTGQEKKKLKLFTHQGIQHYLIDVVSPKKIFSADDFKKLAGKAIGEILKKKKIPIICGGTGFYIHALLGGQEIPQIPPDWELRKKLEKKSAEELLKILGKLNPERAKNIDPKNKRRLIRAIEILRQSSGLVTKNSKPSRSELDSFKFDILWLGIKKPMPELKKIIDKRVDKMIKAGLEKEVKKLVKKYGRTKVLKNTIGYQEWTEKNPAEKIKLHTLQYAKRQITWFKKYAPKIKWVKNNKEALGFVKKFLKK